jgi:hypothetical protein
MCALNRESTMPTPPKAPKKSAAGLINTESGPATPMPPSPLTSPRIRHLAGVGAAGGQLTQHEVRELAASVLAHIEPRRGPDR